MTTPASPNRPPLKEWLDRLDRIAGNLNAALFVVAIGLAMLDFTMFVANFAIAQIPLATAAAPAPPPGLNPLAPQSQ
jgi:hypothetical protein